MIAPQSPFIPAARTVNQFDVFGDDARSDERAMCPIAVRPDRDTDELPVEPSPRRRFWLRLLFALDIPGAGGPGLLMLASPEVANDLLFAGGLAPGADTQVLGCVWLSLGLLSAAGMLRPVNFSPVLVVQFGYKLLWLALIGLPSLAAGRSVPPVMAAIFTGWVVAVGIATPWKSMFSPERSRPQFMRKSR